MDRRSIGRVEHKRESHLKFSIQHLESRGRCGHAQACLETPSFAFLHQLDPAPPPPKLPPPPLNPLNPPSPPEDQPPPDPPPTYGPPEPEYRSPAWRFNRNKKNSNTIKKKKRRTFGTNVPPFSPPRVSRTVFPVPLYSPRIAWKMESIPAAKPPS